MVFTLTLCFIGQSQIVIDANDNYYDVIQPYDHFYDSLLIANGIDSMDGTGYKQYMHWKSHWEPLVQPSGNFIDYFNTKESKYECFNSLGYFDNNGYWDEIGPTTSSDQPTADIGRLSCIEIDPANDSIVLAGSPKGGLWYTTNLGEQWHNGGLDRPKVDYDIDMFRPGISSIVIIHRNDTTFWIVATGDKDQTFSFSRGVLRSIDYGQHWEMLNGLSPNNLPDNWYYIRKLIRHPENPEILFALTSRGIYKTSNGLTPNPNDVEWTKILVDDDSNANGFFDLEFHASNPDIIIVSREYRKSSLIIGNEIIWSEDGGETWDDLPGLDNVLPIGSDYDFFLSLLEVTPANDDIMYVYVKGKTYKDPN